MNQLTKLLVESFLRFWNQTHTHRILQLKSVSFLLHHLLAMFVVASTFFTIKTNYPLNGFIYHQEHK